MCSPLLNHLPAARLWLGLPALPRERRSERRSERGNVAAGTTVFASRLSRLICARSSAQVAHGLEDRAGAAAVEWQQAEHISELSSARGVPPTCLPFRARRWLQGRRTHKALQPG